jgi:T-complex protein 1 subunit gamma
MQVPVAAVLNANTKRDTGKKAQYGNIAAAKVSTLWTFLLHLAAGSLQITPFPDSRAGLQAVADIVRTTLGPRAMLKMLLDASGGECSLARQRMQSMVPPGCVLYH